MNMNNNPTVAGLADLIRDLDDGSDHHKMWIDRSGDVHVQPRESLAPDWRDQKAYDVELFARGNGYVGSEAAADDAWLDAALRQLQKGWAAHQEAASKVRLRLVTAPSEPASR